MPITPTLNPENSLQDIAPILSVSLKQVKKLGPASALSDMRSGDVYHMLQNVFLKRSIKHNLKRR